MELVERKIDKLGRIVLPMDFRRALGLEGEVEVVIGVSGNIITVKSAENTCRLCGSAENVFKRLKICSECIAKIKADDL